MSKSIKFALLASLMLSAKLVLAAGSSSPVFVEYSMSAKEKKSAVSNVLDNASDKSTIYIYYHDSKSQDMANKIKDKIQDKVPATAKIVVLDQATGTPKYTGTTPDGVAIVANTGN